jgi:hypothetical protein
MKRILVLLSLLLLFSTPLYALTATITWPKSPSTDVIIYRVYQSTQSGVYSNIVREVSVNSELKVVFSDISSTVYTYWVITAVDANNNESDRSSEISTKRYIILKKLFPWMREPVIYIAPWFSENQLIVGIEVEES